ncbi:DHS-like NAD/FAD-binding domain-containing protein [Dentipellis sp. KUC8613]|nr:DHS-like NAD/FAD-binding domain-containing protein [Dentipellis sp. KUC8613]
MSLASPHAFALNPSRVWQFYHYRREKALAAKPNAAHESLALLSIPEIRQQVAPDSAFTLITQNVDGLSTVALHNIESQLKGKLSSTSQQEPQLVEMHGRLFDVVCTSETCGHWEQNKMSPICPALAGTENSVEAGAIEVDIPEADLPRCSKCGALARPGVVWFGEQLQQPDELEGLVDRADFCLVIGTSSTVHPAALYAGDVYDNGGKVAVFNLERTPGDEEVDFLFLGPCEEILPQVLDLKRDV